MKNYSDHYRVQPVTALTSPKRIGSYLADAGLLTSDQIMVILNDQQATGMRFGEIVVARGWLKEQTIEWIVQKVIEPERTSSQDDPSPTVVTADHPHSSTVKVAPSAKTVPPSATSTDGGDTVIQRGFVRREAPISKPLPSVKSSDGDVNWVG